MKLEMIMDREFNNKLFWNIANETTPFAEREGVEYKGWALETVDCNGKEALYCDENGQSHYLDQSDVAVGIRPLVNYSQIKPYSKVVRNIQKGYIEVEFGEYPQYPAKEDVQEKLNKGLLTVEKTGKNYTVYNNDEENPGTIELEEVIDKDGNKYVNKNNTWYMVSPISWIVDENNNIALSKKIISGGIPYGGYKEPPMTEWEKEYERNFPRKLPESVIRAYRLRKIDPTIIEGYLNVVLSKDILPEELSKKEEFINREIDEIKQAEKAREERYKMLDDFRVPLLLSSEWIRRSLLTNTPTKLQREDFSERLVNPGPTESERLLASLVNSLSDENIKEEAEEKGLNQEETKVFVKRKVELRDTLKGYKK